MMHARPFTSAFQTRFDGAPNDIHEHLLTHFDSREVGSVFVTQETTRDAAFADRQSAIKFAEGLLREALETGSLSERPGWKVRLLRWKPDGSVDIEARTSRVVGLNALVEITDQNRHRVRRMQRNSGGRNSIVPVIDGVSKRPVTVMQVSGGPRDDGSVGLYTMYPGEHAPTHRDVFDPIVGMSGPQWWSTRAFAAPENGKAGRRSRPQRKWQQERRRPSTSTARPPASPPSRSTTQGV